MKTKFTSLFYLLVILWQYCGAQEYNFINYNVSDGLPQSQVFDIIQDSKSYLWFATQGGGASKFDGTKFETLTTRQGLPSNDVNVILEDQQNLIWFGTERGLCAFDHKKMIWKSSNEIIIHSIFEKSDSILWIGTNEGLFQFNKKNRKFSKREIPSSLRSLKVNSFLRHNNKTWLASSQGLYLLEDNKVKKYGLPQGLLSEDIKNVKFDGKDKLWIAQFGAGLSCMNINTKKIISAFNIANISRPQHIFLANDKEVYISTQNNGLQILNLANSEWSSIDESKGLAHNNIKLIFEDSWNNLWIASSGAGVIRFLGQNFSHYNSQNGLAGNRIYAVMEDSKNTIWLSVSKLGISTIDSLGIHNNVDSNYIGEKCNHIFEDEQSRMWFSTAGEGIYLKDSTGFRNFRKRDGLSSDWISSCIQDSLDNIWVGTYADGLIRIHTIDVFGAHFVTYKKKEGLPDLFITALAKDPKGKIWFSTKKGNLGYLKNDRAFALGSESGLPKLAIRSIQFDSLNNIFIGTAGEGIYFANYLEPKPRFKKLLDGKMSSENIYLLIHDVENNLWSGSEKGLDKIMFNESGIVTGVQYFGKNEGFFGIETCHNAAYSDSNNDLWFGTLNGLTKHTPRKTKLLVSKPNIHFTGITLMQEPIELSEEYAGYLNYSDSLKEKTIFGYNKNNLGFNFKAINLNSPSDITYSWKLDGLDQKWSSPSSGESVNYTNLKSGSYTFNVKAIGSDNSESKTISTSFEIEAPFWRNLWFNLLMGIALCTLAYIFFKNKISAVRKKESKKRMQLELENDLLSLEQKALQLQMNPHFIFNALNSIQSLVVNQKTEVAREQIQSLATLMRGILSNSRKNRISLKEEYETLHNYLKMEQFCQTAEFDFELTLPSDIDLEEVELPPMMIQPFVENAIFHGISNSKRKGKVSIKFEIKNNLLCCEIVDNGIGRERSKLLKGNKKQLHQSTAIKVTRERLKALRKLQNYDYFSIVDVLDSQGNTQGTKVLLAMPLEQNF